LPLYFNKALLSLYKGNPVFLYSGKKIPNVTLEIALKRGAYRWRVKKSKKKILYPIEKILLTIDLEQ
jgi:hypothetical protein